jgi:hypothetical protein
MKLKGLLGALAPTIGSSIGGPMGGMAMKMVAAKLGTKEEDPVKMDDAIVNLVLGYLGGLVTGVTSFYFGSSHNGNK